MLSSAVKNCIDFFALKPPMVIFLISLCFMVVTTVSLTVYIKYNNDIKNTDRLESWMSLSKQLNDLDLCSTNKSFNLHHNKHYFEEGSFTTLITANTVELKNRTKIHAIYNLEDWQPKCQGGKDDFSKVFLTVSFQLPRKLIATNESEVCAIVSGPKQYFPQYSEPACDPGPLLEPNSAVFYSSLNKNDQNCVNTNITKIKLMYDTNIDAEKFSTFLSQADKNVIIVHLTWCTYTLLVIIVIMMLYAMLYRHDDQQKIYW